MRCFRDKSIAPSALLLACGRRHSVAVRVVCAWDIAFSLGVIFGIYRDSQREIGIRRILRTVLVRSTAGVAREY